ncbi:MAG: hypothetical protein ACK4ND_14970 [Cytophagaceae bacterium]
MKNHFFNVATVFCLLILTLFGGCKKEEEYIPYRFYSLSTHVLGGKLYVQGRVYSGATNKRKETGFILGSSENVNLDSYLFKTLIDERFVDGVLFFVGNFESLELNTQYYVRAYNIDIKDNIVYSEPEKINTGCIDVDRVTPNQAGDKDIIAVYGKNFNNYKEDLRVEFHQREPSYVYKSVPAQVLSDNVIQVVFDAQGFTINNKISVTVVNNICNENIGSLGEETRFLYE